MLNKLKLKFDPNQNYQLNAINSVVRLFEGLTRYAQDFSLRDEIVPNLPPDVVMYESWLLRNLQAVRQQNRFESQSHSLEVDDGLVLEGAGNESWRFPSFTIEMETGTGKTYVYLRTIYELRQKYGFSKFIIVVPSIAIYEGVIKTAAITRDHFRSLYGNETVDLIPYDGARLNRVRSFATSNTAQVLVMTLDAFNKTSNILYKPSEKLPGERRPYQYLQETRPIVILDEPQSIDNTEKAKSAIRTLHPLLGLRYSATHRVRPNLIYQLTPVEAYRQNLVKKIQVIGLSQRDDLNRPFLALESVQKKPIRAKVKTYIQENGVTKEAEIILKDGDDLFAKTRREEHRHGYVVKEISVAEGNEFVLFENEIRLLAGDTLAPSRPEVFRAQIEQTVKQHMETQTQLQARGIKVLSLFFIDRVANYTSEQGIIRKLFDEAFNKLKSKYPSFKPFKPAEVRDAYFAKTKTNGGEEVAIDTDNKAAEREAERAAFELIMRKKERLLSFDEPVSFIFAHSALKEGWDNPNVFQICTLNQTVSEIKKRQEIGRGLRLCVNQDGERVLDEDVNVLTVVANESYASYVTSLQHEYVEADEAAPPPPKQPQTSKARRNDAIFKSADFKAFWQKLNRRTHYHFNLDPDALIAVCVAKLNQADFPDPVIVLTRGRFVVTEFTIRLEDAANQAAQVLVEIKDTDGKIHRHHFKLKAKDDLVRFTGDERLRGYKVLEVTGEGDKACVKFNNGEELTIYRSIFFQSEQGQRPAEEEIMTLNHTHPIFNLIDRAAKETNLTRPTLNTIFQRLEAGTKAKLFNNPEGFANIFITTVKDAFANHIADRIEFSLDASDAPHDAEDIFPPEKSFPQKELLEACQRGLYDKVQSDSEIESRFVEHRLKRENGRLLFYFKFPRSFKINFPKIIGNYNPDWGIVRLNNDGQIKLHLVRETKGSTNLDALRFTSEGRKVKCAQKHFAKLGIDYRHIKGDELRWWDSEDSDLQDPLFG